MTLNQEIMRKFKLAIRRREMTQQEIADHLGVGIRRVSAILNGERSATLDMVERLAAALEVVIHVEVHDLYEEWRV